MLATNADPVLLFVFLQSTRGMLQLEEADRGTKNLLSSPSSPPPPSHSHQPQHHPSSAYHITIDGQPAIILPDLDQRDTNMTDGKYYLYSYVFLDLHRKSLWLYRISCVNGTSTT